VKQVSYYSVLSNNILKNGDKGFVFSFCYHGLLKRPYISHTHTPSGSYFGYRRIIHLLSVTCLWKSYVCTKIVRFQFLKIMKYFSALFINPKLPINFLKGKYDKINCLCVTNTSSFWEIKWLSHQLLITNCLVSIYSFFVCGLMLLFPLFPLSWLSKGLHVNLMF
jgi:hypothetical protein